mmetsp:Transcript_15399/g.22682  ORF Transcript_15399/g.22682 Transcript_15399/m.22682 type:complete len:104 (+) Transcript_15399:27-338(+)
MLLIPQSHQLPILHPKNSTQYILQYHTPNYLSTMFSRASSTLPIVFKFSGSTLKLPIFPAHQQAALPMQKHIALLHFFSNKTLRCFHNWKHPGSLLLLGNTVD